MKRLYSPEWCTKDLSGHFASSEGGYGWTCPSCSNSCVCAGCERKAQGSDAPPKKRKIPAVEREARETTAQLKVEAMDESSPVAAPTPTDAPTTTPTAGDRFAATQPIQQQEHAAAANAASGNPVNSDDKSAAVPSQDGMSWPNVGESIPSTLVRPSSYHADGVHAQQPRSHSDNLMPDTSEKGQQSPQKVRYGGVSQLQPPPPPMSQLQHLSLLQQQQQFLQHQLAAAPPPSQPSTLDALIRQLQSQSHDVNSPGYLQARAQLEHYLQMTAPQHQPMTQDSLPPSQTHVQARAQDQQVQLMMSQQMQRQQSQMDISTSPPAPHFDSFPPSDADPMHTYLMPSTQRHSPPSSGFLMESAPPPMSMGLFPPPVGVFHPFLSPPLGASADPWSSNRSLGSMCSSSSLFGPSSGAGNSATHAPVFAGAQFGQPQFTSIPQPGSFTFNSQQPPSFYQQH
jgi:hypothetical protein